MTVHLHDENTVETAAKGSDIERILDITRWAPSGDNTQPWRFEIVGEDRVVVSVTRKADDIYDFNDGQGSLLSTGFMLETMRIAATRFGRAAEWSYLDCSGLVHRIAVDLPRRSGIGEDPLLASIPVRSVDRGPFRMKRLDDAQKTALRNAIGPIFEIKWYETWRERLQAARINARTTDIRLRLREAYEVHRRIIDWDRNFSPDGVPARAIGLDPLTLKSMRWAMAKWNRIDTMNRVAGTGVPQLELDLLPGIRCAGHFTIQRRDRASSSGKISTYFEDGQAVQRFWLQATAMGLSMQPAIAPIVFGFYAERGGGPNLSPAMKRKLDSLGRALKGGEGFDPDLTVYRGRVGWPARTIVKARSVRKPLQDLISRQS